jgi:hypothetical protein
MRHWRCDARGIRAPYATTRTPCTVVTWLGAPVWMVPPCACSQAKTFASSSATSPWLAHQRAYAKKRRSSGAAASGAHSRALAAKASQLACGSSGGGGRRVPRAVWASASSSMAHASEEIGHFRGSHRALGAFERPEDRLPFRRDRVLLGLAHERPGPHRRGDADHARVPGRVAPPDVPPQLARGSGPAGPIQPSAPVSPTAPSSSSKSGSWIPKRALAWSR